MHRALLSFALASIATTAVATTVLDLPLDQLARTSPVIVEGVVSAQQVRRTPDQRIETLTTVNVTRSYRQNVSRQIVVWQGGGTVGDVTHAIPGDASFREGEEVLLFLEPAPAHKGGFVLVAMSAAKFSIDRAAASPVAIRDVQGLGFARPDEHGVIRPSPAPVDLRLSLESLRRTITDALP